MLRRMRKFLASEDGATAVEYALLVSLIVLAALAGLASLGERTVGLWSNVASLVDAS